MFDAERRKKWANRADFAYTFSSLTLMLAGIFRGVIPFIATENLLKSPSYIKLHGAAVLVVFLAAAIMLISWIAKRRLGPAAAWTTLQALCNKLQSEVFTQCNERNELLDDHRVTLFRYQKRAWRVLINTELGLSFWKRLTTFNKGWLVPVLRSGDASRGTNSVFKASKNGRAADFEGMAGQAWGRRQHISVAHLPLMDKRSKPEHIHEYALKTFMSPERVQVCIDKGKPLARSFWAHSLSMKGGLSWGVIVLDSQSTDEINHVTTQAAFKWISEVATELLKEVS